MLTRVERKKLREEFSACSTGGAETYYKTRGHGVNAFDGVLQSYDIWLCRDTLASICFGKGGRAVIPIVNEYNQQFGLAVLTWYQMPETGNWEVIGYIA